MEGNSLVATKLGVRTTATSGDDHASAPRSPSSKTALARLDFNLGKLTFLSDMEPAKVVERSGIGLISRYRKDANLDGEPIILEKQHAKGISLHAHTELDYKLDGKYKEFKALLGVDTRTGADSQAMVSIYCDGEKKFTRTVSAKMPQPIAINVKDVTTLQHRRQLEQHPRPARPRALWPTPA